MIAVRASILLTAALCLTSCASSGVILARAMPAVYPHWILQCDDPAFVSATATFLVEIDEQGRIVGEPQPVDPQDTPGYRAVAASALTALKDAQPYPVPRGFEGGSALPKFNPGRACTGRPD